MTQSHALNLGYLDQQPAGGGGGEAAGRQSTGPASRPSAAARPSPQRQHRHSQAGREGELGRRSRVREENTILISSI